MRGDVQASDKVGNSGLSAAVLGSPKQPSDGPWDWEGTSLRPPLPGEGFCSFIPMFHGLCSRNWGEEQLSPTPALMEGTCWWGRQPHVQGSLGVTLCTLPLGRWGQDSANLISALPVARAWALPRP